MTSFKKAVEQQGALLVDEAIVDSSIIGRSVSYQNIYTDGNLTRTIYYRATTQTTINRAVQVEYAYNADLQVISVTVDYYEEDGITLFEQKIITPTYTNFDITSIDEVYT